MIKKLLSIIMMATFAFSMASANEVVFTAGTGNDTGETSVTKDGVTITMSHMNYPNYYVVLALTDMVVTADNGVVTGIEFNCTEYNYGATYFYQYAPEGYSYDQDGLTGRWSGYEESVTLRPTSHVRITKIVVNAESNPTAVNDITASKTVDSVKYYNAAGMASDTAFDGINIVVTRYTDGTTSTTKVKK